MKKLLRIAFRNLLQSRQKTLILGSALGLVAMLLVLLMALSQGVSDTMRESATILVSGHVNVAGFYKAKVEDSFPLITDVKAIEEVVRKSVGDELDYIVVRQRGWGKIISASNRLQVAIHGVLIENEPGLQDRLRPAPESAYKEGGSDEVFGDISQLGEQDTVAIFESQAKRLEVGIGDPLTLTTESLTGRVNTKDVRIIAVLKDIGFMSNWSVFSDSQGIQDLYQLNPNTAGALQIYLKDPDSAERVMQQLRESLSANGHELLAYNPNPFWQKFNIISGENWTGQKLDLTLWENEVSFLKWAVKGLDGVSFFLVAILLFIIAIGIINSMLMSVRERTREIGSLRAIGMHRREVLLMFLFEALLLGLGSTALGSAIGASAAIALNAAKLTIPSGALQAVLLSDTLHLAVNAGQILQGVFLLTLFVIIASLIPASRAASLEPVKAIHHTR